MTVAVTGGLLANFWRSALLDAALGRRHRRGNLRFQSQPRRRQFYWGIASACAFNRDPVLSGGVSALALTGSSAVFPYRRMSFGELAGISTIWVR